jgi:hypothetical protein
MQRLDWHAPTTGDPIRAHTRATSNARIDRATFDRLDEALQSSETIRTRLRELDTEWTIDRALMLNFAIVGSLSGALALHGVITKGRISGWAAVLGAQLAFLAHHAIRRWCPPMPVLRRLGFRSDREICAERVALQRRLFDLEVLGPRMS